MLHAAWWQAFWGSANNRQQCSMDAATYCPDCGAGLDLASIDDYVQQHPQSDTVVRTNLASDDNLAFTSTPVRRPQKSIFNSP
jgi:hypothetical protein